MKRVVDGWKRVGDSGNRVVSVVMSGRYEAIAVLVGALIMVLEIVGARMIAPYFGSSIYVWTAVIGVILGALSLGYWWGGRVADRMASDRLLALILVTAAFVLLATLLARETLLHMMAGLDADIRARALLASLVLFAPVNILMGMVSPMLAKLKVTSLDKTGSSVGGLYAAGTAGSILGTFASGYWLIAWLGNWVLGLWLVVGLLVASVMARPRGLVWARLIVALAVALTMLSPAPGQTAWNAKVVYDGDTAYSRFLVLDVEGDRPQRLLVNDNLTAQSGIYRDTRDESPFNYIRRFVEAGEAAGVVGAPKRVLLVGGGAYVLPHLILNRYPEAQIDVVEIDPKLDELAERYFGYQPDPRVRIIHEDGRTFLNANQEKYNLIFLDAFNSFVIPFQLTTTEMVAHVKRSLAEDGAVVANLVAAREGPKAAFVEAEYATYLEHFEDVRVAPVLTSMSADALQNLLLVAGGRRAEVIMTQLGMMEAEQPKLGRVLTDDFAPVEQLAAQ